MKDSIPLTQMPVNYTGYHDRLEVMAIDPDIHDAPSEVPGVYLQHVEGCGYTVYRLTADEARFLGERLIAQAADSLKQFSDAGRPHIP
jgi:hypothetical protein